MTAGTLRTFQRSEDFATINHEVQRDDHFAHRIRIKAACILARASQASEPRTGVSREWDAIRVMAVLHLLAHAHTRTGPSSRWASSQHTLWTTVMRGRRLQRKRLCTLTTDSGRWCTSKTVRLCFIGKNKFSFREKRNLDVWIGSTSNIFDRLKWILDVGITLALRSRERSRSKAIGVYRPAKKYFGSKVSSLHTRHVTIQAETVDVLTRHVAVVYAALWSWSACRQLSLYTARAPVLKYVFPTLAYSYVPPTSCMLHVRPSWNAVSQVAVALKRTRVDKHWVGLSRPANSLLAFVIALAV